MELRRPLRLPTEVAVHFLRCPIPTRPSTVRPTRCAHRPSGPRSPTRPTADGKTCRPRSDDLQSELDGLTGSLLGGVLGQIDALEAEIAALEAELAAVDDLED